MKLDPFPSLACPLEGQLLRKEGKSVLCPKKHCFDFDRYGTLNLLPVQFKKSKDPGDSKEMVEARTRFLDAGFYQPISNRLNDLVADYILDNPDLEDFSFVDAACGEGYYTGELATHLGGLTDPRFCGILGVDISKEAIIAASRRSKEVLWTVGTNAHLPALDKSTDAIFSLFGFPVWSQFKRILKPNGIVVEVLSGPEHLIELRNVLYPEIKDPIKETSVPHGFKLLSKESLTVQMPKINQGYLEDLLIMTPHGYRATDERKEQALETDFPSMTLDVIFRTYSC